MPQKSKKLHGNKQVHQPGERFGRLTLVAEDAMRAYQGRYKWIVRCDCGELRSVVLQNLTHGHSTSCGCLAREATIARSTTHGGVGSPEHNSWRQMRARCMNSRSQDYSDYGERGITICDAWASFPQFLADMGPRPGTRYSLGRIDNDGPYSPENCRWENDVQQARNRRSSRLLTYQGKTQTLVAWAIEAGLKRSTLQRRIDVLGWSVEDALATRVLRRPTP